jgi:hypothetical protein
MWITVCGLEEEALFVFAKVLEDAVVWTEVSENGRIVQG